MREKPKILHVVGARPNFVKIAPVLRALEAVGATDNVLLHSGQHYDVAMSDLFFRELGIRSPDINLGVGSASHGRQTGEVLWRTEEVLVRERWAYVIVVGDVNSTLAAALAAAKLGIPVAHVEAGLRSRDRTMPEEINRVLTDQIADLCLTPSRDADRNLLAEGIEPHRIEFVGNVMIDTLLTIRARQRGAPIPVSGLKARDYVVVTLHRPSNVDDRQQLQEIVLALEDIARHVHVVFPVHPRTRAALQRFGFEPKGIRLIEPLGYKDMLTLQENAGLVITDSGGIQEETTVLGVPCLTLRSSTERPITVDQGTNRLVPVRTRQAIGEAFAESWNRVFQPRKPEGWDGRAAERIAACLHRRLGLDGGEAL